MDAADRREFVKISQAVGIGFVVMGAIGKSMIEQANCVRNILTLSSGYVVKLSKSNPIVRALSAAILNYGKTNIHRQQQRLAADSLMQYTFLSTTS